MKGPVMMTDVFSIVKIKFHDFCRLHDLLNQEIRITGRVLTEAEAIGDPEADDFPLQTGKERLMEADFLGAKGQAFTDRYGDFAGRLDEIFTMPLENNYRRAVFVASLNAVLRHLGKIDRTIHCRNKEPKQCADELADYIRRCYGDIRITQVGFQPRMVETLSETFDYRILDLDPANIGTLKGKARVEGPDTYADAVQWADLLLVTGTTLVNKTVGDFLVGKPVLFYGTTIAGAALLMNWDRFCAKGA
jgi:hypothetical protein